MKTLLPPVRVTVEQVPGSIAVAYVSYSRMLDGSRPPTTKRISQAVNVDFDEQGVVLGIELVGVDANSLAVAVRFASEHYLHFPRDLSGCITDSRTIKADQVVAQIRHWTNVYLDGDTQPTFRGILLWHDEGVSIIVNGDPSEDNAIPASRPVRLNEIARIEALTDPSRLVESNKVATTLRAERLATDDR